MLYHKRKKQAFYNTMTILLFHVGYIVGTIMTLYAFDTWLSIIVLAIGILVIRDINWWQKKDNKEYLEEGKNVQ